MKQLSLFLFIVLFVSVLFGDLRTELEIEDYDFCGRSVLVTLSREVGGINMSHSRSFFGDIEIESIRDLTEITASRSEALLNEEQFRQILSLRLPIDDQDNVLRVIYQLRQMEGIDDAVPNHFYEITVAANDPYLLNGTLWGMNKIQAPLAWTHSTGSHSIKVGIIDTGMAEHADLNANLTSGWDFVRDIPNTNDIQSHGTHVAGTVGAVGNNGIGVVGVNWNVTMVPMKIHTSGINVSAEAGVLAINYAINNNVHVLNYSISGFGTSTIIRNAVMNYSGVFVWSAGNNSTNRDNVSGIASFNLPNLISVGATTSTDARSSFSCFGQNSVNIFAPGTDIWSTVPNAITPHGYRMMSGTSMAAPHVAGVAALLYSINPSLTAADIKEAILDGADIITIHPPIVAAQNVRRLNALGAIIQIQGIQSDPRFHDFGDSGVDFTSKPYTFTISNNGEYNVTLSALELIGEDADQFDLINLNSIPKVLAPHDTLTYTVAFSPTRLGNISAHISITHTSSDVPMLVPISGVSHPLFSIPYLEDFNSGEILSYIHWGGVLSQHSGIRARSGVGGTNGLTLNVWNSAPTQTAFTPLIGPVTETTYVSFEYRIVSWNSVWPGNPSGFNLTANDRVYIEISSGFAGPFVVIDEINRTNHTTSNVFKNRSIPISFFEGETIVLRFRPVRAAGDWIIVLDDVHIYEEIIDQEPLSNILSTFTATVINIETSFPSVNIQWTTASETNLLGFHILRQTEDTSGTTRITANMIPATNTSINHSYSFVDEEVSNGVEYWYWLQTISNDGTLHLHDIRLHVVIPTETIVELPLYTTINNVFPNPVRNDAQFEINVKAGETARLRIFNIRGQIVKEFVDIPEGENKLTWDRRDSTGRDVSSGVYFYQLSSPSVHSVRRMVVVK